MDAPEPASTRLQRAWQRRAPVGWALWPLSLAYGAAVSLRQSLYRAGWLAQQRADCPVLVVGNVIAGGAGKTPVTIAIVEYLRSRGWRPGVVSRGYGRKTDDCRAVQPGSQVQEVGDEPALIARRTGVPVFVARQRYEAVTALRAAHPDTDVIVCDDGLQHLALARDMEICVFNDEGLGNGLLLPAGPLREPWPRAVHAVLHSAPQPPAGTSAPAFAIHRRLAEQACNALGGKTPLTDLQGQGLHAVAAIARPAAFFTMLEAQGLEIAHREALPDHYNFDSWSRLSDKGLMLVCTEKDAVKLWPRFPDALAIGLEVEIDPGFFALLDASLSSRV